jgi:hypothetical protein
MTSRQNFSKWGEDGAGKDIRSGSNRKAEDNTHVTILIGGRAGTSQFTFL